MHGVSLGTAIEHARLVKATEHVAERLDLEEGALVLKLDRVVRTADGLPIEWRNLFTLQLAGQRTLPWLSEPWNIAETATAGLATGGGLLAVFASERGWRRASRSCRASP